MKKFLVLLMFCSGAAIVVKAQTTNRTQDSVYKFQIDSLRKKILSLESKPDSIEKTGVRRYIIQSYIDAANSINAEIKDEDKFDIVSPKTFRKIFSEMFSTIITGNNNLVKNTTGASWAQDKDKGSLTINYAHFNDKKAIYNLAVIAETSGSIFNIYSNNNWNNGIGINGGASFFTKSHLFYSKKEATIAETNRKKFEGKKMTEYAWMLYLRDSLHNQAATLNLKKETELYNIEGRNAGYFMQLADSLNWYNKMYNQLDSLDNLYAGITDSIRENDNTSRRFYKEKFADELAVYELKSTNNWKYSIHWISTNIALGQSSSKLYSDTLSRDSIFKFSNSDFFRCRLSAAYNYTRNNVWLNYFSGGLQFYNTNFLEGRNMKDLPFVQYDTAQKKYVVFTDPKTMAGNVEDYKARIWVLAPSAYYAVFFGKERTLGFQFNAALKLTVVKPKAVEYKNSFDASVGMLFNINKSENIAKGTIGAEAGLFNATFGSKVWNEAFAFRLKIGVPISTFIKKEDK